MVMEGMLWKWTNYFSGWQLRWFVLENGILSYYKSEDDVNNGCKGSVKVSACDVSVHPTDFTRLDLTIPGEAHFYVKAATPQERQQWLVALGTAKACLTTGPLPSANAHDTPPDEERLRVKKSELRLYSDLLMQQVHSVKCSIQNKQGPNVEELNEATSLLGATCDTFIKTLDECVSLANAKLSVSSSISDTTNGGKNTSSPSSHHRSTMATSWNQTPMPRVKSADRCSGGSRHQSSSSRRVRTQSCDEDSRLSDGSYPHSSSGTPTGVKDDVFLECNGSHRDEETIEENESHLPTYFSSLDSSFPDIRLTTDLEIPTIPFLDACRAILPIIDKLNENAFVPAKLDIVGNIKKVHQKYLSAPDKFQTLQKIVGQELSLGQCQLSSSATMALLWLTRTLQFIQGIIEGLRSDEEDLRTIVNNAYGRSLRDYHGWVIRSAFAMAVRSVPTKQKLLQCFAVDDSHVCQPAFEKSVLLDLSDQSAALSSIISILHSHLVDNGLNFPDQV